MKNNKVLVYDSGLGGLNVLYEMKKRFGGYEYFYMSNSKNAPYGGKSVSWLYSEAEANLLRANAQEFGAVVIACNTLSTTVLPMLKRRFSSTEFFGVFPRLEIAEKCSTLLLCTQATSKSIYIMKGKKKYKNLRVQPLPDLVEDIENGLLSGREICLEKHLQNVPVNIDVVILGCTHFCFLKSQFGKAFPNSRILCSEIGADDHRVEKLTTCDPYAPKGCFGGKINFILDDSERNCRVFECLFDKMKF